MPQHTQAELFIKTLAELRDAERESRTTRLRDQHKVHAERFMKTFWAEVDDTMRLSEWRVQDRPGRLGVNRLSQSG
ncbi:hypothetical protein [Pararhodobacter sp. SW119]|uniref:hypothetical protein n=1 Tax=Pararhodobacter sp. SW119 TaxID=2780075 RepID=UPI001AE02EAD|nr:hypothetical protein [Pararhodobacter sp. SW119]